MSFARKYNLVAAILMTVLAPIYASNGRWGWFWVYVALGVANWLLFAFPYGEQNIFQLLKRNKVDYHTDL